MSKEQADEPVLWYRPRVSLSGTVIIPSDKSFKKFEEQFSTKPSKKSAEVPDKKPEMQDVLVIPNEKPAQSATAEVVKKKRGRKPKSLNTTLEVSTAKPEAKTLTVNESSKSAQPKKLNGASEPTVKKPAAKPDSAKPSLANGKHNSEAIVVIEDDVEPAKPASKVKPSDKANGKHSGNGAASETSQKFAEFQKAVREKLDKAKEQDKRGNELPSSTVQKKNVEADKIVTKPESIKKAKANEALSMSCPDPSCLQQFSDHASLIDHIKENHSLQCKMPYCTFMTFTFQEYCDHFEQVHCANTVLPMKRGPRVAGKEQMPSKEAKVSF